MQFLGAGVGGDVAEVGDRVPAVGPGDAPTLL